MAEEKQSGMSAALAAVVPCYNAGHRVVPVVEKLLGVLDKIVVVDDGCTDGCIEPLRPLPIRIEAAAENQGKGHALLLGIRAALEDPAVQAVCLVDADGQHDPAEIPALYTAFTEEGADLVIGVRTFSEHHVPWLNRAGNRLTTRFADLVLGCHLPDTQCGFRLLSRRFAEDALRTVRGGRYQTEMEMVVRAVRGKFHVVHVPITTIYEDGNPSSHISLLRDPLLIYGRLLASAWRHRK